jgi:hypothetical protein
VVGAKDKPERVNQEQSLLGHLAHHNRESERAGESLFRVEDGLYVFLGAFSCVHTRKGVADQKKASNN